MIEVNSAKRKLLVICGPSGSGKSHLEKNLIEEYPDIFYKLPQVTTRKPRPGEVGTYTFINSSTFDYLSDKLIGKLGISKDTIFKDKYGTIPDFKDDGIATIILAKEAILDLKQTIEKNEIFLNDNNVELFIIGLDIDVDQLSPEVKTTREGRGEDFIEKEKEVLVFADQIFFNINGRYVMPNEVIRILQIKKFI